MIFQVIAIIVLVSVLLAVWSLEKQKKLEELKEVKKDLSQGRVIYDSSSSKELSDLA
jgi:membrane-anchored protein YejM (alkaline phosphatase superfamily)